MNIKAKNLKVPFLGRLGLMYEPSGQGVGNLTPGRMQFQGHLYAQVIRNGKPLEAKHYMSFWGRLFGNVRRNSTILDLGTGLVTNIGVLAMANDFNLASPSGAAINVLKLANWHASGTGTTAAAVTDYKLQTVSTQGGQTPVAGAQSIDSTSTLAAPKYKSVATIAYTGTEAVTEWGLFTASTLTSTTGTPFTATTATSFTATGTPFTASSSTVQGLQQQVVEPGTTTVLGLIASNTTSVGTLVNNGTTGWFTRASGVAGSTPGSTETYTLRPVMWDHKVFSAINVVNGDSIQFTYVLTVNSGG